MPVIFEPDTKSELHVGRGCCSRPLFPPWRKVLLNNREEETHLAWGFTSSKNVVVSNFIHLIMKFATQRNILVHEPQGPGNPLAWVADFGLSADEEATTFVTHSDYRAPELRGYHPELRPIDQLSPEEKAAYDEERHLRASQMEKADVYSFGWTVLYVSPNPKEISDVDSGSNHTLDAHWQAWPQRYGRGVSPRSSFFNIIGGASRFWAA
jgi:hypothetical protein